MTTNSPSGFKYSRLGMTLIKLLDEDRYYCLKEVRNKHRRQSELLAYNAAFRDAMSPAIASADFQALRKRKAI